MKMSEHDSKKLGLFALVAMVIGSMIGGGAFNLISDMGSSAGGLAIIIGWVITGIGMIALGFSFQNLTTMEPDLDGGVYSYAKAGFGDYMGFNSAWGYWISAFLGNVAYGTLLMTAVGNFFPIFKGGANVPSIIAASVLLWLVHFLILKGVKGATFINTVVTVAKMIPIFLFIVLIMISFNFDTFMAGFHGMTKGVSNGFDFGSLMTQVKSTMLVTLWVFIGIEGAVVFSSRAKKRSDVGKATLIGLIAVLLIYMLITILAQGVVEQGKIADLTNPSMAAVMAEIVGPWGASFINIGLIISVLGAWLGWTLLAGEVPYLAAKDNVFPAWFGMENENHAPVNSLLITNILIQLFFLTLIFTDKAYNFAFSLASSAILIPYAFSAFYQVKYALTHHQSGKQLFIGIVASVYAVWLVYAAGLEYLLLTMILYFPGIIVYQQVQKSNNKPINNLDKGLFIGLTLLTIAGIYFIFTGKITVF
ncbi:arginine-ornithine antiporter [Macrococcoides caseolyticum]|uniref:arginine-ornithine antiporter n=1 Tax=Macrococcoides caseolyticum TaxID=69966 RepID=UPI003B016EB2